MGPRLRPLASVAAAAVLALLASSCTAGPDGDGGGRVSVVAALYPLAWVAERIGGDRVDVVDLTPPGVEAHDASLSAEQRERMQSADVILVLGDFGFQPDVERAAAQAGGAVVDVTDGLDLLATDEDLAFDPHLWLDPVLMLEVVATVGEALAAADPDGADAYASGAAAASADLRDLDAAFVEVLGGCAYRGFVTSHEAFSYLAARYGLSQIPLEGPGQEAEPSAAAIQAALAAIGDGTAAPAIFAETTDDARRIAEAIAQDADVEVAVLALPTLESAPTDGDYLSQMRGILDALAQGLGCPA